MESFKISIREKGNALLIKHGLLYSTLRHVVTGRCRVYFEDRIQFGWANFSASPIGERAEGAASVCVNGLPSPSQTDATQPGWPTQMKSNAPLNSGSCQPRETHTLCHTLPTQSDGHSIPKCTDSYCPHLFWTHKVIVEMERKIRIYGQTC